MTPEEKIAKVVKQLKDDAAINPDPTIVKFELNDYIVGAGILSEDEERRILFKLEKTGAVKLRLTEYFSDEPKEVTVISSYEGERFARSKYYWVQLMPGFEKVVEQFEPFLNKPQSVVKKSHHNSAEKLQPTFAGDLVMGDKVGRDKASSSDGEAPERRVWFWVLSGTVGLIVVIAGYMITEGKIPAIFTRSNVSATASTAETTATTTPGFIAILDKALTYDLSKDTESFLANYKDKPVYGRGVFKDINVFGDSYTVYMYVGRYPAACAFDQPSDDLKRRLDLLRSGDPLPFYGEFTGSGMQPSSRYVQNPWYIRNCNFY